VWVEYAESHLLLRITSTRSFANLIDKAGRMMEMWTVDDDTLGNEAISALPAFISGNNCFRIKRLQFDSFTAAMLATL
jgi:hypothetical protein